MPSDDPTTSRIDDEPGATFDGPSASIDLRSGDRVGRYVVRQHLGEGGFGSVYLAEQTEPVRRKVALKVIKLGMDTRQVIARFEAERQALALMDHPNIARVLDAGATDAGRPFFVMELVRGVPLTTYCDQYRLTQTERLELFVQVTRAIQHAHQKGIIHRDIKPSNVLVALLDGKPVPKVIDFGVAKATNHRLTERTLMTEYHQLVGTPQYMSPEQAEMSELDIDTRTDVYSLGVLLYELLTGSTPFDPRRLASAAYGEIQRIIREEEPPRPSTRLREATERRSDEATEGGSVSGEEVAHRRRSEPAALRRQLKGDLDWIVMKAMEKARTRRYDTASALGDDIRRHLDDEPVNASPPSASYRLTKLVRRNRGVFAAAAVVFVILLGAVIGVSAALAKAVAAERVARTERAEADRQRTVAETQRIEAERQARIAESVNAFLNEDLLAAVDPRGTPGNRDVTVREVLDAASATIDGLFPDEPLVEAAVRETLGETYLNLDELDTAERHLLRAVELRRGEGDHRATVDVLNLLALSAMDLARFEDADRYLREAAGLSDDELDPGDALVMDTLNNFAALRYRQGRLDEAEQAYLDAIAVGREHHPTNPGTYATAASLALIYQRTERHAEAEPLSLEAIEGYERLHGREHPDTLTVINNLAILYGDTGRFDQAEPLFLEVLDTRLRTLGEKHRDTLVSKAMLARAYIGAGRFDDAERYVNEAHAGLVERLGADHPYTVIAGNILAELEEAKAGR